MSCPRDAEGGCLEAPGPQATSSLTEGHMGNRVKEGEGEGPTHTPGTERPHKGSDGPQVPLATWTVVPCFRPRASAEEKSPRNPAHQRDQDTQRPSVAALDPP